jgi:hypothetical protein
VGDTNIQSLTVGLGCGYRTHISINFWVSLLLAAGSETTLWTPHSVLIGAVLGGGIVVYGSGLDQRALRCIKIPGHFPVLVKSKSVASEPVFPQQRRCFLNLKKCLKFKC